MTTDLLAVWTDPDTAMHAVGTSLGIFAEPLSDAGVVGPTELPLRNALLDLLLQLVDDGELEKRACADGRYAFRWRDDTASPASTAVSTDAVSARLDAYFASMPRAMPSGIARAGRDRSTSRLFAMAAPLVLPALSCMLALFAFVVLGNAVGVVVVVALALPGVVGLVRRVPLAGFWTTGLIVAGLLVRMS